MAADTVSQEENTLLYALILTGYAHPQENPWVTLVSSDGASVVRHSRCLGDACPADSRRNAPPQATGTSCPGKRPSGPR